jgi:hypothetical protein
MADWDSAGKLIQLLDDEEETQGCWDNRTEKVGQK